MGTTRKSVIYSVIANFGSIATSLILVVIVARWLLPAEIGAFAVAYAIFNLLEPLRQSQMIAYVVQAPVIDRGLMRSVTFVGWVTTACVLTAAIVIGLLLHGPLDTPQTGTLLLIMSVGYVLSTLCQPALAVLSREMRFGVITGVNVSGGIVKAAVTVLCLVAGLRSEALAIGIVAEIAVKLVLLFKVERDFAVPVPSWANTRDIWNFCLKFTGADFINRLSIATVDILVGSFLGLAAAGFYNRAAVLIRTMRSGIEGAIMPVAIASFAKTNRQDASFLRQDYLTGISLLTGVTWSALAFFIVAAEPLIMTIYGPRWQATIILSQVLSAGAFIFATTAMIPALFASIGKVESLFRRNMKIVIPRLLILSVTVQYDLITVALGELASLVIASIVNQALLRREFGIGLRALFGALWRSAVLAGLSSGGAVLVAMVPQVVVQPAPLRLIAAMAATGIIWLVVLMLVGHPLRAELVNAITKLRVRRAR